MRARAALARCGQRALLATRLHPETRFRPAGRKLLRIAVRASSAKFFKSLLCLKVALRVHRTHRHAAEIQLLQQLADAALMQMNIEFGAMRSRRSAQRQRTTPSVLSQASSTHFATSLRWASARRADAQAGPVRQPAKPSAL